MKRSALAFLLALGCSRQTAPAMPSVLIDVGGYTEGYPIAIGTEVLIGTDWSGECTEGGHGLPMPGLNEAEPRKTSCDSKSYSIEIWCERWGKRPGPACNIRSGQTLTPDKLSLTDLKGSQTFHVAILGDRPVRFTATIERDNRRSVHHSPWLYPMVLDELATECRLVSEPPEKGRPCDGQDLPKGTSMWMIARAASDRWPTWLRVNAMRVNGVDVRDGEMVPLSRVLPPDSAEGSGTKPGDYKLVIEANPAPYTIKREVTIRVR